MKGRPGPDDLWGKFADDQAGPSWLPLLDHSVDVACVLEALLRQPTIRRRLARAAGQADFDDVLIARLCYLAFLHDLGKCHLGFRAKAVPTLGTPCGHIQALKPLWTEGSEWATLLSLVDAAALDRWFGEGAGQMLHATFAHHGGKVDLAFRGGSDHWLLHGWTGRGREPFRRVAELLDAGRALFPAAFADDPGPPSAPALQHLFAGLLMLADWLGSGAEPWRFPFDHGQGSRPDFVRRRAPEAMAAVGLAPRPPAAALPSFTEQFRFAPRAAQAAIDTLPLPGDGGSVVLIESETGSGKTEAALRWASRLMSAGLVDGCFFAVPLRTAAVQLHRRMQSWADADEVLLAVPGYYRMGEAEGRKLPDFQVQWTDGDAEDRRASRWAAEHPKRYAAARLAVGTIDQALLATLPVKHAHLRAACLVRHLLVIDEVHASDAWMTALAERLIGFFAACGGHVLLMSATLGADTRQRLVGGTRVRVSFEVAVATAYPRITTRHAGAVDVPHGGRSKQVQLRPEPLIDRPDGIARLVRPALEAGGRVLVLRNTVAAAIETQAAVEALLGADHPALFRVGHVATLHHGRFAAEDRRLLDQAVEDGFGKAAPPGGALVVGTQTLEMSLDLDADLLVTDLCPVDVLLQRIGRLHRHAQRDPQRPASLSAAQCIVLVPDADLSANLVHARHSIGKDRAYPDVVAVQAAWNLVAASPSWALPEDNRRLVEEGTHPERLKDLATTLGPDWKKSLERHRGATAQDGSHARNVAIDFTEDFDRVAWSDGAEKIATRLGAADLLLPVVPPLRSPFGETIERLKLPFWMAPPLDGIDEPVFAQGEDGALTLQSYVFSYSRYGVSRL